MVGVKRGILVFGCAVAFAAAPLVVASPAAADCPWGTKPTRFEVLSSVVARGSAAAPIPPVPPSSGGANIVNNRNGYGSVNGVPCNDEHWGACQAMIQNGG